MLRRGQITLFIIVGLALLVVVGVFLLATRDNAPSSLAAEQAQARANQLVQSCLASVGEDVLREMGTRGGYADTSRFKSVPDQRSTQTVVVGPQTVVLWNEVHPCSEHPYGCPADNRPPLCRRGERCPLDSGRTTDLPSIQEQLEGEIALRVPVCVRSAPLEDLTFEEQDDPEARAQILDQEVALELTWPLAVTASDGSVVRTSQYTASLPVRLPRLYEFAAKVQQTHALYAFPENVFLHLLAIYSGVDEPFPPIRDVDFFGTPRYWVRTAVQQRIEEDVLPFMNLIQIANAIDSFNPVLPPEGADPDTLPFEVGLYQYLNIKMDNVTYPLEARIEYPQTPIYLDINGKELLKPKRFGSDDFLSKLSGMLFTQYKFGYTAAFPLLVHVTDRDAFNGEGYTFTFGLEANLYKNHPYNLSVNPLTLQGYDARINVDDLQQLVDHTYTVTVTDRHTGAAVPRAAITLACGSRYAIGSTDDAGKWTGKLPYCFTGGGLVIERYGYAATGVDLANTEDDGASSDLAIAIWPRAQKSVVLFKRTSADTDAIIAASGTPEALENSRTQLTQNDFAFVTLARVKETRFDDDVPLAQAVQFGTRSSGAGASGDGPDYTQARHMLDETLRNGGMTQEQYDTAVRNLEAAGQLKEDGEDGAGAGNVTITVQQVDLVPGEYALEGMLIYSGLIQIPAKEKCEGTWPLKKCFTLPAQNFSSWPSGGMVLAAPDMARLSEEFIYSDRNLTLFVLEQPLPATWDGVERAQDIAEYQGYGRRAAVMPDLD